MNFDEVSELMQENKKLKEEMYHMKCSISELCGVVDQIVKIVNGEQENIDRLLNSVGALQATDNNLKYEIMDKLGFQNNFFCPQFRSDEETIRLIVEEGKSLGRFGDGEFSIAFDIPRQKFQHLDEQLKERIWQVLQTENDRFLIAIAKNYGCLDRYNEQGATGIRMYMTEETRMLHQKILPAHTVFSDAYITRPYVIHKDNMTEAPRKRFEALKAIWQDKDIVFVEGAQTRLGVGNDLFENVKSIRRILAPATSSFDRYEDILKKCLEIAESVDLFMLAIGPSSGILAFDLSEKGYQAVDVGHIDIEYEWFLAGQGIRVPIPNKYNNEVDGGDIVEDIDDPLYQSQVICSFA